MQIHCMRRPLYSFFTKKDVCFFPISFLAACIVPFRLLPGQDRPRPRLEIRLVPLPGGPLRPAAGGRPQVQGPRSPAAKRVPERLPERLPERHRLRTGLPSEEGRPGEGRRGLPVPERVHAGAAAGRQFIPVIVISFIALATSMFRAKIPRFFLFFVQTAHISPPRSVFFNQNCESLSMKSKTKYFFPIRATTTSPSP